jgi:hypothetical protein
MSLKCILTLSSMLFISRTLCHICLFEFIRAEGGREVHETFIRGPSYGSFGTFGIEQEFFLYILFYKSTQPVVLLFTKDDLHLQATRSTCILDVSLSIIWPKYRIFLLEISWYSAFLPWECSGANCKYSTGTLFFIIVPNSLLLMAHWLVLVQSNHYC